MSDTDKPDVAAMRRQYTLAALHEEEMLVDPVAQFTAWFKQALDAQVLEPNAMSLATAWADGRPLLRTVLLKNYDERGFVFYTNLGSRKARQLKENPNASLLFPWLALERQVIVTGKAEKLSVAETLKYFITRPRDSQIGAWASQQSSPISSRQALEMEWESLKRKFSQGDVPLPDFWGGFRVVPETIEFWQGGPNRLHDRMLYSRRGDAWKIERLAP
jgi:pyridoxamine 5'-phosphate oxidase